MGDQRRNCVAVDAQPMPLSPKAPNAGRKLPDGIVADLFSGSFFAVVVDADLAKTVIALVTEHQQQISSAGVALLTILGANP